MGTDFWFIYSKFHVLFNGHSPENHNDPHRVEIIGPASLKKNSKQKQPQNFCPFFMHLVMAAKGQDGLPKVAEDA